MTRFARLAAPALFTLITLFTATGALAADYPVRPIKWVVPYTPGGTTDVLARIVAQWLSEKLGQSVIVDDATDATERANRLVLVRASREKKSGLWVAGPDRLPAVPGPLEAVDDPPSVGVLAHPDSADRVGLEFVLAVVPVGCRDDGPKLRVDR